MCLGLYSVRASWASEVGNLAPAGKAVNRHQQPYKEMSSAVVCRSKDHMPALRRLDPLPTHELAIRLFYLYDHFRREPVVDSFPDATQVSPTCCTCNSKLAT